MSAMITPGAKLHDVLTATAQDCDERVLFRHTSSGRLPDMLHQLLLAPRAPRGWAAPAAGGGWRGCAGPAARAAGCRAIATAAPRRLPGSTGHGRRWPTRA